MTAGPLGSRLWHGRAPMLTYALGFRLFESFLFIPAASLVGAWLSGRPVIDSPELAAFLLEPRGFLVLLLGAVAALTIRLAEHAGLAALALNALEGWPARLPPTFRFVLGRLPGLVRLGLGILGLALLVVAPVAGLAGALATRLLARHDINFYLATRPPEFLNAVIVIAAAATLAAGIGFWLLVRWRFVVQVHLFDGLDGWAVFRESDRLSRGIRWTVAGWCVAVGLLEAGLLLAAAAAGHAVASATLSLAGTAEWSTASLAFSFGSLVLLRSAVGAAVTVTGPTLNAAVFTALHRARRQAADGILCAYPTSPPT